MEIEKKAWPDFFQDIVDGKKTFDLRLAEFECKPGDTLVLKEWNPDTKGYTGRTIRKEITYVLNTKDLKFWPDEDVKKKGFIVMSFK